MGHLRANGNPLTLWFLRFFFLFRKITPTMIVITAANIPPKTLPTIFPIGRWLAGEFLNTATDGAVDAGAVVVAVLFTIPVILKKSKINFPSRFVIVRV